MATVRARESFAAFTDHGVIGIGKGQALEDDDPIVKARPHMFVADNADDAPKKRSRAGRVEKATANPGEYRDL